MWLCRLEHLGDAPIPGWIQAVWLLMRRVCLAVRHQSACERGWGGVGGIGKKYMCFFGETLQVCLLYSYD